MSYVPPVDEMRHVLEGLCDLAGLSLLPGLEEATPELVGQVLEEAGRLAAEVIAPLNRVGDRQGARLENGVVVMPDGFGQAWRLFREGGWNALPFPPEEGGMGLPWAVATAVQEMWQGANLAFGLCPLLNQAAIEALRHHAPAEVRERWLRPLAEGRFTGTMCMTEPQAGSDVGAIRTRARRDGEVWRITGTKIFITYGEHELAENICHLVLARTEGAPDGTRGLSLFLVPKRLPTEDGRVGPRNDLRCVSLEHKLGIHASPTCVMAFGESEGAIGWLLGEELGGMGCMFTMMNNARIAVGLQGLGMAERAYQAARAFAAERVQGRRGGEPVPIARHPDIRRTLATMRATVAAMRAITYTTAAAQDRAQHGDERARRRVDLLTPVVKAWCSDRAVEICSAAVQVHGGMGYVEETGVAQLYRDVRILPIYEGTTGIQARDLVRRKLRQEGGRLPRELIEDLRRDAPGLGPAIDTLERATRHLQATDDPDSREAAATPYLHLMGSVVGACLLTRAGPGPLARFYTTQLLPQATALLPAIEAPVAGIPDTE
jgi:3-(methylthio)propanoyl-CoA dehydrogenase